MKNLRYFPKQLLEDIARVLRISSLRSFLAFLEEDFRFPDVNLLTKAVAKAVAGFYDGNAIGSIGFVKEEEIINKE